MLCLTLKLNSRPYCARRPWIVAGFSETERLQVRHNHGGLRRPPSHVQSSVVPQLVTQNDLLRAVREDPCHENNNVLPTRRTTGASAGSGLRKARAFRVSRCGAKPVGSSASGPLHSSRRGSGDATNPERPYSREGQRGSTERLAAERILAIPVPYLQRVENPTETLKFR
jgi:hypothetical protein